MYTFSPRTRIESAKVNANFTEITSGLSTGILVGDGSGDWYSATGTWSYISATSFSVPTADAAKMNAGTRIKLTQTTVKYFTVASISGTTVTIDSSTSYTLTSATISAAYSSNASCPPGFPDWFSYTPTWVSQVTQPVLNNGTLTGKFSRVGKTIHFRLFWRAGSTTTFGSGNYYWGLPVAASSFYTTAGTNQSFNGGGYIEDNTVTGYAASAHGLINSTLGANQFLMYYNSSAGGQAGGVSPTTPFTFGSLDYINFAGSYEAA